MLPERLAVGLDARGAPTSSAERAGRWRRCCRLATRARTCPPTPRPRRNRCPSSATRAIAGWRGRLYAAAIRPMTPPLAAHRLQRAAARAPVHERLAAEPENRVLAHHAHCALDYACPTASNLFLGAGKARSRSLRAATRAASAASPSRRKTSLVSPQDRLTFLPTVEEIVAVGVRIWSGARRHLQLRARAARASRCCRRGASSRRYARCARGPLVGRSTSTPTPAIRARCNASTTPGWTLCAPARSRRGARPTTPITAPSATRFDDVKRSLILAREAGVYTSINLLCFPGLIDCEDEVEALLASCARRACGWSSCATSTSIPRCSGHVSPAHWRAAGHARADRDAAPRAPEVEIGNFSRPVSHAADMQ